MLGGLNNNHIGFIVADMNEEIFVVRSFGFDPSHDIFDGQVLSALDIRMSCRVP